MPAATAGGLPYPVGTEPVRDGDNAIKALADALQARGHGSRLVGASQVVTANSSGTGSVGFTGFSVTPAVLAVNGDNAGGVRVEIVSTVLTGFNYSIKNMSTDVGVPNATVRINWMALGPAA